ncbi:iron complex outermembrane recepter protein [Elysia marginata]|uniref:Iron complex outermembrane recepter protein n=1 Tax=Elysia marginata TaxID=1093978 RepID=A0AAV4GIP8_9GAST|nr:iron complex outermembrane recepter protein [Elysia marginata]
MMQQSVKGIIVDADGKPLAGVDVLIKGQGERVVTNLDGVFELSLTGVSTLVFRYLGYETQEVRVSPGDTSVRVVMQSSSQQLTEVSVVGSRNPDRTSTDSPVPVDVITPESVVTSVGRIEVSEMLQFAAPSFNANKQNGADGADHIVPATLRGLGPDQVLVLINGKRRHQSSLINLMGTRGRGNTGTDLNAIPQAAIKRIEVLRDGAAAQYGSDAIAGVINIVTKDASDTPQAFVNVGAYNTNAQGEFPKGAPNTENHYLDDSKPGNATKRRPALDGESLLAGFNYSLKLGEKGGFVNITGQYKNAARILRASPEYRKGFGGAALKVGSGFVNAMMPLSDNVEFYVFGGSNFRHGDSYAFTRNPNDSDGRSLEKVGIYPNGFTPKITSKIVDNAITAGIRTAIRGWNVDFSNTFGKNTFHYRIIETVNATLLKNTPHEFDAGGHALLVNTTDINFNRYFDDILSGFNLAFGGQYRVENFEIFSGEEASYSMYDTEGKLFTGREGQEKPTVEIGDKSVVRPGGSQGFPGYSPDNVVDKSRSNLAVYLDTELDITEKILLGGALRFENYTDFGNTLTGKLTTRIKLLDGLNFRASASTGFRAPSLAQRFYNLKYTNISETGLTESFLASNVSPVAKSFGIESLKQETSVGASAGLAAKLGIFTFSVDAYWIDVANRILLTGIFDVEDKKFKDKGIDGAQFFINGADTRTLGLDLVVSAKKSFGDSKIGANLTGNINNMEILKVNNTKLDRKSFFGMRDQHFVLASAPNSKFALNLNYEIKSFNMGLTFTRFAKVTLMDNQAGGDVTLPNGKKEAFNKDNKEHVKIATDTYTSKLVTDLVLGFKLHKHLKFSLGSNNLFNIYPDQQTDDQTEQGGYWDSVQMGASGAYYFARLNYQF